MEPVIKYIARKLDRLPSPIHTVLKQEEHMLSTFESRGINRDRATESCWPAVEKALLAWLKDTRSSLPLVPITDALLEEKVPELAMALDVADFMVSSGYIAWFKMHHSLESKLIDGEGTPIPASKVSEWLENILTSLISGYNLCDTYDMNEVGLVCAILPHRILRNKRETCQWGKQSNNQVIALLGANMDGSHKLEPLIIGLIPEWEVCHWPIVPTQKLGCVATSKE